MQHLLTNFSSYHIHRHTAVLSMRLNLLPMCLVPVPPAQEDFVSLAELEDSLLRNLFKGYQKWVRPVQHANDTITVRFGLKISQLVDVVRPQHTGRTIVRIILIYMDGMGRGGNIKLIRAPSSLPCSIMFLDSRINTMCFNKPTDLDLNVYVLFVCST